MLAPRSIIGNGNKQGPPTLLVTLPQPKGGYMHLALMNCHEHLPAQKLFAKLHVREQLSFRSLSFSIIEVRSLRTASVLLNDISIIFFSFVAQDWIPLSSISKNSFRSIHTSYRKRYWILLFSYVFPSFTGS